MTVKVIVVIARVTFLEIQSRRPFGIVRCVFVALVLVVDRGINMSTNVFMAAVALNKNLHSC